MRKSRILVWWIILGVCMATGATMYAQLPSSTVYGSVKDPQGAPIAGAQVTITSIAQGLSRQVVTNIEGLYVIPSLPIGRYDMKIEERGFETIEFQDVVLEAGKTVTLNRTLSIAKANTVANVTAMNQSVNLSQSMIQGQITSTTIQSMPLNGRNFLELAYLVPGNRPAPTFDPTKTNMLEISSAGGFGRGGNITVDGADNNDEVVGGTLSNFPIDSIAEFQIATARFTSEVGRSGNSIVNIVTKSGTNTLHGSLFFFERSRNLQALPATLDRNLPTPPFDREQYGGSVGGPIKTNRAWWFTSFEYRDQNAALLTGTRDFATDQIINTSAPAPLRDLLLSNRVDTQINRANAVMVRYSFNRSTNTSEATPSQETAAFTAAERQNSLNHFNSFVTGLTTIFFSQESEQLPIPFRQFSEQYSAISPGRAYH